MSSLPFVPSLSAMPETDEFSRCLLSCRWLSLSPTDPCLPQIAAETPCVASPAGDPPYSKSPGSPLSIVPQFPESVAHQKANPARLPPALPGPACVSKTETGDSSNNHGQDSPQSASTKSPGCTRAGIGPALGRL